MEKHKRAAKIPAYGNLTDRVQQLQSFVNQPIRIPSPAEIPAVYIQFRFG